jgi:hypothetical protein
MVIVAARLLGFLELLKLRLCSCSLPNHWSILKILFTLLLAHDACRIVPLLLLPDLNINRIFHDIYGLKIEVISHQV